LDLEDEGLASICVKNLIFSIFDNQQELAKMKKDPDFVPNFVNLAKLIMRFDDDREELIQLFIFYLVKKCGPNQDKEFINQIMTNNQNRIFLDSKSIQNFIVLRFCYLRKCITELIKAQNKKLCWKMPHARIPDHPLVEVFLRSDRLSMVYSGPFKNKNEAIKFINNFSGCKNGYSVNMSWSGSNILSQVFIRKTRTYFENKLNTYAECNDELKCIENFLRKNNITFL
jgi:hypothetical protein